MGTCINDESTPAIEHGGVFYCAPCGQRVLDPHNLTGKRRVLAILPRVLDDGRGVMVE